MYKKNTEPKELPYRKLKGDLNKIFNKIYSKSVSKNLIERPQHR